MQPRYFPFVLSSLAEKCSSTSNVVKIKYTSENWVSKECHFTFTAFRRNRVTVCMEYFGLLLFCHIPEATIPRQGMPERKCQSGPKMVNMTLQRQIAPLRSEERRCVQKASKMSLSTCKSKFSCRASLARKARTDQMRASQARSVVGNPRQKCL